jgi:hypothetical protein
MPVPLIRDGTNEGNHRGNRQRYRAVHCSPAPRGEDCIWAGQGIGVENPPQAAVTMLASMNGGAENRTAV